MKKITTAILVLAFASATIQNAQAQTNTFPATGNVGIGTLSPASKLDILPANGNALTIRPYGAAANNTGQLQFRELAANGVNYVGLRAPDALASNLIFRLPTAYGTNGQVLGTTGSGVLTWVSAGAGGGASTSLNNLTATSINMALLPSATNLRDLGSAARAWRNLYTTGIYPRTGGTLGFGIASSASLATFANLSMAGISGNGGLQIGATNTYNLVLDNNEMQARNNGTASPLYLQYWGGDVNVCSSGGTANFYGPVAIPASNLNVGGRVGIKTAPSYDLHVSSTDYTAAYIQSPYNGGTALEVIASGTTAGTWGLYSYATTLGYAAYFSGNIYCSGSYLPSDERLKENIEPLQNSLNKVMKLDVKTYNFKSGLDKMNLPTEKQYGFLAQNLESVFPELVKLNPAKKEQPLEFKAVNYIGMIPILTEAMQEQQKQIEAKDKAISDLQNQLNELKQCVQSICDNSSLKNSSSNASVESTRLFQNQPNPFNQTTVIRYALSAEHSSGVIVIRDLGGNLVKSIAVFNTGNGQVTVNANEFNSGTYTYSLEIGKESVDTKLMVITK